MKVTTIRFQNINSLKGIHEIHFDKAPFSENGLFAITGPTGAGKTSILDAITAALYGRVHRHDKDAYESMTRHTAESYAEVEFEVNESRYRSKWSVRKSRGNPAGTMQTPKMELSNALTGEIIVSHPISEVQQAIIKICGLDYSQFLRSVMLSQGDFTRFLKANENERSELLEKITDTGIYSDISSFIFHKAKEESIKLENLRTKLNDVKLLSEEEVQSFSDSLRNISEQEKNEIQRKKVSEEQYQWLTVIENLERKKLHLQNQYDLFLKKIEANQVLFQKLYSHQQVLKYQPSLIRIESIQKQLMETGKQLSHATLLLPRLENECAELVLKSELLKQDYTKVLELQKKLISIFIETEKKDTLIENKVREIEKIQTELKTSILNLDKLREVKQNKTRDLASMQVKLDNETQQLSVFKKEQNSILAEKTTEALEHESSNLPTLIAICEKQLELSLSYNQNGKTLKDLTDNEKGLREMLEKETLELLSFQKEWESAGEYFSILQKNVELQLKISNYEDQRKTLSIGEPCPLCGSVHHPYIENDYHQELEESEKKRNLQKQQVDLLSRQINEKQLYIQKLQFQLESSIENQKRLSNDISAALIQFNQNNEKLPNALSIQNSNLIQSLISNKKQLQQEYGQKIRQIKEIEKAVNETATAIVKGKETIFRMTDELENCNKAEEEKNTETTNLHAIIENETQALHLLKEERFALFEDKNIPDERNRMEKELSDKKSTSEKSDADLSKNRQLLEVEKTRHQDNKAAWEKLNTEYLNLNENLANELQNTEIIDIEDLKRHFLPEKEATELTLLHQQSEKEKTEIEHSIQTTTNELIFEQKKKHTDQTKDDLSYQINHLNDVISGLNQEIGKIKEVIHSDNEHKIQFRNIADEIESQQKEFCRWEKLSRLIGSADGKKFSRFAQGLTLARLTGLANRHLSRLTDRYNIIKTPGSDLLLEITDHYQADIIRSMNTLSGGESFLVSLALALGLSELASRNTQINSLFIDEGFGTLDAETLDIAITALENLQANGKTIGIISHVDALKERIRTQIQVNKQTGGYSTIKILCDGEEVKSE